MNAIAGGGGLVSLPVMLSVFPDAPLPSIFGTTKSAMIWGTAWAARSYAGHVSVSWRRLLPALVMAVSGGFIGAWLLTCFSRSGFGKYCQSFWDVCSCTHWRVAILAANTVPRILKSMKQFLAGVIAFFLGVYDGFFGPGTGSFFVFFFGSLFRS